MLRHTCIAIFFCLINQVTLAAKITVNPVNHKDISFSGHLNQGLSDSNDNIDHTKGNLKQKQRVRQYSGYEKLISQADSVSITYLMRSRRASTVHQKDLAMLRLAQKNIQDKARINQQYNLVASRIMVETFKKKQS